MERENIAKDRLKDELREEEAAEHDYEKMLQQEAERMKIEGYTGRVSVLHQEVHDLHLLTYICV